MIRVNILLVVVLGLALHQLPLQAQDLAAAGELDQNAALSYWQAFALMPPIDEALRKQLAEAASGEGEISEDLQQLIADSENALKYLHRGGRCESCSWGIASEEGPYAYLPHLAKARELSRAALLRARIRIEAGQVDQAIDDIVATVQLGRRAGQEGVIVLINILVGMAIEAQAIENLAHTMHLLDQDHRDLLARRLQEVQPALNMEAAIRGEKDVFLGWLIRQLENGGSSDSVLDLVSGDIDEGTIERVKQASPEQLLAWARGLGSYYDEGLEIMRLSPEQADARMKDMGARLADSKSGNPLGLLFLPAFASARHSEAAFLTRKKMLEAALAAFASNSTAFDRPEFHDPFGDGPFQTNRIGGDLEIVSDFKRGDRPVRLRVVSLAR